MIPAILEILACLIAAISGFLGLWIGANSYDMDSIYLMSSSAILLFAVYAYLSSQSELLQKAKATASDILICKVIGKAIYVIFALQLISAALMVK